MSKTNISKKLFSILLAALTALSVFLFPVAAVEEEKIPDPVENSGFSSIEPCWDNVTRHNLSLTFSGKKINSKIVLNGKAGTKYKNGTVTVSKYSGGKYVPVKSWTGLSASRTLFTFSNSELSAVSGVKYKLSIKITAYTSSKSEVVTANKVATCP